MVNVTIHMERMLVYVSLDTGKVIQLTSVKVGNYFRRKKIRPKVLCWVGVGTPSVPPPPTTNNFFLNQDIFGKIP